MKNSLFLKWIAGPIAAIGILVMFQNCSKGLQVAEDPESSTFKQAASCMSSDADACVFEKNAVAQAGKAVSVDRIGGYQLVPVALTGRDGSGALQNADFIVNTSSTPRLTASSGFRRYYNGSDSSLEQIMAYVAANRARNWMQARGVFPAEGKAVKIYVDSGFNAWLPDDNEIHLERNDKALPAALDETVTLHFYAQANIHAASAGRSHEDLEAHAGTCEDARAFPTPYGCCEDTGGCGPAIVSGASDYFAALQFESNPLIGEGWKNSPSGLTICGLSRNPAAQGTLTTAKASSTCKKSGSEHNVTALGLVYASIWWEVRKEVADKADFDKLFLRHLGQIRGDDDFAAIKAKILSLDTDSFAGRYGTAISTEFAKRGL